MTQPKRLMLVEDSATQAALLRRLFEEDQLAVIHVSSAELALEHLKEELPDVIVLDYRLPGMNGNEFCRHIRLNVNTRAIPVLMLTAEDSNFAQMQGLESGADDYVAKSSDPDILRVRVLALIRKRESTPQIVNTDNRFSRARLLVIDDSPTWLHHISTELEAEHYTVETADSPTRGLARAQEATFDCVIVDFEMPGLNGDAVVKAIRGMHKAPALHLVIIVMTSHEDKKRMTASFEAGADDFISKSADIEVIRSRIRALVRRKFLVEENRRIFEEIKEKELEALRAKVRAEMADQLSAANAQLARANQELEQFAYAAAHDLQEPLRKVSIFSELLLGKLQGKVDEDSIQYLNFCMQGAKQMDQLIKDLLLYAGATKSSERPETPTPLERPLQKVLSNLEVTIADTGAVVTSSPLPSVFVDEIRIQQLFQNLIGNALKYRKPGETPRVTISAERSGGLWRFSVADNGIGISPQYFKKVFELFQRLDPGTYPGTGLGLAICKRIVDQLGGSIWVESEQGNGSTFWFTIPNSLSEAAEPAGC